LCEALILAKGARHKDRLPGSWSANPDYQKGETLMKRRDFLASSTAAGLLMTSAGISDILARQPLEKKNVQPQNKITKLTVPENGVIPVAITISTGVTMIDYAGPWEVFQDVMFDKDGKHHMPFKLYTVSQNTEPVRGSAGLKIIPDYTFENAPMPKVVVIPAQLGSSALHEWLRKVTPAADVTMSVCTGAFQLAKAGLLAGKTATTHHAFIDRLAKQYPDINVKSGLRFVEGEKISTAGGLTSGIDLALRVVERYFGREVAEKTAVYMEYQSKGWMV
jgi:transcriptional regulator GlxA family with amidase domain